MHADLPYRNETEWCRSRAVPDGPSIAALEIRERRAAPCHACIHGMVLRLILGTLLLRRVIEGMTRFDSTYSLSLLPYSWKSESFAAVYCYLLFAIAILLLAFVAAALSLLSKYFTSVHSIRNLGHAFVLSFS